MYLFELTSQTTCTEVDDRGNKSRKMRTLLLSFERALSKKWSVVLDGAEVRTTFEVPLGTLIPYEFSALTKKM